MRIAIFSDVHAIPQSLVEYMKQVEADNHWFLGDSVGYGPQPLQTLRKLHKLIDSNSGNVALQGNHDEAVVSIADGKERQYFELPGMLMSDSLFTECAQQLTEQHAQILCDYEPEYVDWLRSLALRAEPLPGFFVAHGSYSSDDTKSLWVYGSRNIPIAREQLQNMVSQAPLVRLIAVGHYHVPNLYCWDRQQDNFTSIDPWEQEWHTFDDLSATPILLNPGSLSLPRAAVAEPCASYALLDIEDNNMNSMKIGFRRIQYDASAILKEIHSDYPCGDRLRQELSYVSPTVRS